ncbi:MAG: hypothetical protein V2A34_06975, partial [Lentisphaerota bacterium]
NASASTRSMSFSVVDDDTNAPMFVIPTNLLQNGGFERNGEIWGSNWWGTAWFSPEAAENGNFGAYVLNDDSGMHQWVPVAVDTTYTLSIRARKSGVVPNAILMKQESFGAAGTVVGSSELDMQPTIADNWQTYSLTFTTPATAVSNKITLFAWQTGGSGFAYLDNIMLQAGSVRVDPLQAKIGSTNFVADLATSNGTVTVLDGALAGVGAGNPFNITFGGYDIESGLSRGNTDSNTQVNVDVGAWKTDDAAGYSSGNSSPYDSTFSAGASNTWSWTSANVDTLWNAGNPNLVRVSMPDADFDRSGDQAWLIDKQVGYISVKDDDTDYPVAAWSNMLPNGSFNANGEGWTIYGWGKLGFDDWAAESGNWGLYILENSQGGVFRNVTGMPNNVYTFTVRARKREGFTADSCYIKAECYEADGSTKIKENEVGINALLTTNWQTFTVAVTSPVNTAIARGVIGVWNTLGGSNYVMFDNANLAEAAPLKLMIGNTVYMPSEQTTNALFYVDAAALTNVSAGNPLRLIFGAYDVGSGLSRGSNDASYQMNVDIEGTITDNTANYMEHESTPFADTFLGSATSTWKWTSFTSGELATLTNVGAKKITVTIYDADADRSNDRLMSINHQFGWLVVTSVVPEPPKVIYEPFDYTVGQQLGGQNGQLGWADAWTGAGGDIWIDDANFSPSYKCAPNTSGKQVKMNFNDSPASDKQRSALRHFPAKTSGKLFVSYMMQFQFNGDNKYAGLMLMSDSTELVYFGEVHGSNEKLGINFVSESVDYRGSEYALAQSTPYMVVGMYDFATRIFKTKAWPLSATTLIPPYEPFEYDWSASQTGLIASINGVSIKAGCTDGGDATVGNT